MVPTANPSVNQINREFEEREAQTRAAKAGLAYLDIAHFPINPDVLKTVDEEAVVQARLIPVHKVGSHLQVAVTNPDLKSTKALLLSLEKKKLEVEVFLCSESGFAQTTELYHSKFLNKKTVEIKNEFIEDENQTLESQFVSFGELEERINNSANVQGSLNEIEIAAVQTRASDIHLQPYEDKIGLRFRIDGILHDICNISFKRGKQIIHHIKYESGMRSNVSDIPQDGHLSFKANGRDIDLRVSTLPTEFAESVVMRVLDSRRGVKTFSELGFDKLNEEKIHRVLRRKNGMVLITGPTGSGKTTTLYSMLAELNNEERKLVTLEDPIEYHLAGVTQSQVSEKSAYNFATGLKSLLRHDPDVVLIGEIRDLSTAKLAAEASLTGHVVFSSLHTNSAIGAVDRLRNLGLESYNVSSALNAVMAQRLVRKVCPHCAKSKTIKLDKHHRLTEALERIVQVYPDMKPMVDKLVLAENNTIKVPVPGSCEKCSHTGYIDQTVICETVILEPGIKQAINEEKNEFELEKIARNIDPTYLSLFESGLRKVLLGITTLDEIYRVAG